MLAGKAGPSERWELRPLSPGLLLPQVLHNEGSWEPQYAGMTLDKLEQEDGCTTLLLVIGTSIRTDRAAKLVRSLAKKVHKGGGVVVYIDRATLPEGKWGAYFDVQLQTEVDKWVLDAFRHLSA
ncbi:putative NAD-dependent histone deacetylase HST3, partial [Rhizoctonia solani 123E]